MRNRRYTRWTDEEIARLRLLASMGLRVKSIARELRRSADAVRRESRRNGVRLREQRLLQLCQAGGLVTSIAARTPLCGFHPIPQAPAHAALATQ